MKRNKITITTKSGKKYSFKSRKWYLALKNFKNKDLINERKEQNNHKYGFKQR